jgi:hypothetical protein
MRISRLLTSIALLTFANQANADECRYGDVKALFNAWPVIVSVQAARGLDTRMVGQAHGATGGPCQYRLFAGHAPTETPPIQTFTSRQFFWGGISWAFPYALFGVTRAQAQGDLELIKDTVYIIPAGEDWSYDLGDLAAHEQPLLKSAFRHAVSINGDLALTQQRGVIEELPPGHYISLWTTQYPGNPELQALYPDDPDWVGFFSPFDDSAIVYLDIVP